MKKAIATLALLAATTAAASTRELPGGMYIVEHAFDALPLQLGYDVEGVLDLKRQRWVFNLYDPVQSATFGAICQRPDRRIKADDRALPVSFRRCSTGDYVDEWTFPEGFFE